MALYKRGNTWWTYVSIDGVRHGKSTSTANRKLAEQIDRKFKDELTAARHHLAQYKPEMRFSELAAKFIAEGFAKAWLLERLNQVLPYFGESEIGHITKHSFWQYARERQGRDSVTDNTIAHDAACLRRVMFWAVDAGILAINQLQRLRLPRARRKKIPVLSLAEELKLLAVAPLHLFRIIICSLDTGMRPCEIFRQQWEDIDFSRKVIAVSRSKTPGGDFREIPLTTRLFELLNRDKQKEGFVFTFEGEPVASIKRSWQSAVKRAGIRTYLFKNLRHTHNSRLMLAGVIKDIRMELLGHSRGGRDVNDLYTHVELPVLRDAIRKLEQWVEQEKALLVGQNKAEPETPSSTNVELGKDHVPIVTERIQ